MLLYLESIWQVEKGFITHSSRICFLFVFFAMGTRDRGMNETVRCYGTHNHQRVGGMKQYMELGLNHEEQDM